MSDLTCIDCIHWYFYGGSPDYSELTPGENWESRCRKGHWKMGVYDDDQISYRKKLLMARNCADFSRVP